MFGDLGVNACCGTTSPVCITSCFEVIYVGGGQASLFFGLWKIESRTIHYRSDGLTEFAVTQEQVPDIGTLN